MLEILSARNTQSTISGINYRKYLHQWLCLPDMQMYVQARKVNEQLSDVSTCLLLFICNLPIPSDNLIFHLLFEKGLGSSQLRHICQPLIFFVLCSLLRSSTRMT